MFYRTITINFGANVQRVVLTIDGETQSYYNPNRPDAGTTIVTTTQLQGIAYSYTSHAENNYEIDNDEREMMLRLVPVIARYMNDAIKEMGIVTHIINVARQRPKKQNTTMTTNKSAYNTVSTSEFIVLRILSDVSTMTFNLTSVGRRFCNDGIISITLLEISTELAPDCF